MSHAEAVAAVALEHIIHIDVIRGIQFQLRNRESDRLTFFPGGGAPQLIPALIPEGNNAPRRQRGGKGQLHVGLLRGAVGGVVPGSEGVHAAAVDQDRLIGVDAPVRRGLVGHGPHGAAVDDQIAVGVDAVALGAVAAIDGETAAVDGGDAHSVFIGVDAVILRGDGDGAAVDGQMQFGVHSLVIRDDVEHTGVISVVAVHIHGHFGIKGPVVLVELFGGALLVNTGHVGAGEGVLTAGGDDDVGAGGRGIHNGGGGLRIIGAALIDIVEDQGRSHRAGHIHIVQNEGDHRGGVLLRVLTQIHSDLPGGKGTGEPVSAGPGDGDYGVGRRLFGGVHLALRALAVGAVGAILVIDDLRPGINGGGLFGGGGLSVHRNSLIGEDDVCLVIRRPGAAGDA